MSHARAERAACVQALRDAGPSAPTLCEGWTTRDLAAHLVIREGRPDAAVGILVPPLSGWSERVRQQAASQDYASLLARLEKGPPLFSVFAIPPVDAAVNLGEYFVHTEDVRRAVPGVAPRELSDSRQRALWAVAERAGRFLFRSTPVGVILSDGTGRTRTVIDRPSPVTLTGTPAELVLYAFGRGAVAQVELSGPTESVTAFKALKLSI